MYLGFCAELSHNSSERPLYSIIILFILSFYFAFVILNEDFIDVLDF